MFTEEQIAFSLKQAETGVKVEDVCRKMGIGQVIFYSWRKRYDGLGLSHDAPEENSGSPEEFKSSWTPRKGGGRERAGRSVLDVSLCAGLPRPASTASAWLE